MRIHDITDARGELVQFEVPNAGLTRRAACKVLSQVGGCRILARPKDWSWLREACFCEAEINGVRFIIEEPFGDNSRFLVSPVPPRSVPELHDVRKAFENAPGIPTWARILLLLVFAAVVAAIIMGRW